MASAAGRDVVVAAASKSELRFGPASLRGGVASLPVTSADVIAVGHDLLGRSGESNLDLLARLHPSAGAVLVDAASQ